MEYLVRYARGTLSGLFVSRRLKRIAAKSARQEMVRRLFLVPGQEKEKLLESYLVHAITGTFQNSKENTSSIDHDHEVSLPNVGIIASLPCEGGLSLR